MMRIVALADTEQHDCIAASIRLGFFQQSEARGLADRDAVARRIERTARPRCVQSQCMKSIQRGQAQCVCPTDNGGIA